MHIDYANRPESSREAAYVRTYCAKLGVEFRCRTINEVTRGITDRDEYEKRARNIRYDFYKQCIAEIEEGEGEKQGTEPSTSSSSSSSSGGGGNKRDRNSKYGGGVIFGHHAGDVQENVVSNVMRGCSP